MMVIDNDFYLGQVVYLKTDIDQLERIVTSFTISKNDVFYFLSCGIDLTTHSACEITETKDVLKQFE